MASYDYYKLQQGRYPNPKPGSNWYYVVIDPSLVQGLRANGQTGMVAGDTLKVVKTFANTIYKCGFYRVPRVTDGDSTADVGTAGTGQQMQNGMDINNAVLNWIRMGAADDVAPVTLTDGYLYWENLGNTITSGRIELLMEIIIPHNVVENVKAV